MMLEPNSGPPAPLQMEFLLMAHLPLLRVDLLVQARPPTPFADRIPIDSPPAPIDIGVQVAAPSLLVQLLWPQPFQLFHMFFDQFMQPKSFQPRLVLLFQPQLFCWFQANPLPSLNQWLSMMDS